jgi:hypothetical protein
VLLASYARGAAFGLRSYDYLVFTKEIDFGGNSSYCLKAVDFLPRR